MGRWRHPETIVSGEVTQTRDLKHHMILPGGPKQKSTLKDRHRKLGAGLSSQEGMRGPRSRGVGMGSLVLGTRRPGRLSLQVSGE